MKKLLVGLMLLAAGAAWGQRDEVPALDWFDPATAINQGSLTETGEVISKKLTVNGNATLDTLSVAEGPATSSVVNIGGSISLAEQAEADADTAGYGQVWVDLATPNTLMFTDDAGTDFLISGAGGTITGSGSVNAVPLWTSASVLGYSTISQTGGFLDVGDELKLDDGNVGQPSLVFDGNTDAGWFYGSGKIQLGVDGTAISTWDATSIDIGHTSTLITLHNDVQIKDDLLATPYQRALLLTNTDEGTTSAVAIAFSLTDPITHSGSYSGSISSAKTEAWNHLPVSHNADMDFYTTLYGGSNQALKLTSGGNTWIYGSLGARVDPATTAGVITAEGSLFLRQQAAADADTVEYGQLWVKDIGEGELWYTDDEGADYLININYSGVSNSLLTLLGTVSLRERAAADAATAGYGQLWVKNSSPAELMFRDDAGTDFLIGGGGTGTLTGGGSTSAIAMFTSSSSLGNSALYDVSGEIGLNTSTPTSLFDARDAGGAVATLSTSETVVVDGTKLGQLDFSAPEEASGTDALLPGASIWAEADADFSAAVNMSDLVFATGQSEAAIEKARLTSDGKWDVTGIIEAGSGDTVITTAAGDVIVGSGGSVDDGALSANVAHLNAAETVSADWDNTANPWADDEVADALTISGGTVDGSAIGGTTPSTGAFTTLTASGNATLAGTLSSGSITAVGADALLLKRSAGDNATVNQEFWTYNQAGDTEYERAKIVVTRVNGTAAHGNILLKTNNTGTLITALTLMYDQSAVFADDVDIAGTIEAGSGDTAITDAVGLILDAALSANVAHLNVAETVSADWVNTANPWADNEVVDALTIAGGTVDNSAIGGTTPSTGAFTTLSATGALLVSDGAATFNEDGNDNDFRIEGVGEPNALFVQGSDGNVGIQEGTPDTLLSVGGTSVTTILSSSAMNEGIEVVPGVSRGRVLIEGSVQGELILIDSGGINNRRSSGLRSADGKTTFAAYNDGGGIVFDNIIVMDHDSGDVDIGVGDLTIVAGALIRTPATITTDTTPTAANRAFIIIGAWTASNDITDFDNETAGQVLKILGGDADCNVVDGAAIQLVGDVTWNGAAGATLELWSDGTVWYEHNRSDAS